MATLTHCTTRPNKARRRLGYASRIHGWPEQSAERLTQTVIQKAQPFDCWAFLSRCRQLKRQLDYKRNATH